MWAGKTARGWGSGWELSLTLSSSFSVIVSRSLISGHTPHDLNAGNRLEVAWCKGIRIPESKRVLLFGSRIRENFLVESHILGFGIRNTAQGIRNPTDNCNLDPSSTDKDWNPPPGNPESTKWNPESKTVLDSLAWGVYVRWLWIESSLETVCNGHSGITGELTCAYAKPVIHWIINKNALL